MWIPKVYNARNRTFFFSFEQFRQKLISDTLADTVPIAAYCAGNVSNLITTENRLVTTAAGPTRDLLGRTIPSGTIFDLEIHIHIWGALSFAIHSRSNQIPVTSFDPVAVKILNLVPQPLGPECRAGGRQLSASLRRKPRVSIKTPGLSCTWPSTASGPIPVRRAPLRRLTICRTTLSALPFLGMPARTGRIELTGAKQLHHGSWRTSDRSIKGFTAPRPRTRVLNGFEDFRP